MARTDIIDAMNTAFTYWFICVAILWFKMFANSIVQGIYRIRNRSFTRPDDAAFFGKGVAVQSEELPIVQRASACWRNDLENIPMFLIIGLGFVVADGSATAALIYFGLFTLARIAHTIFYLRPTQPWRNIAYQLGTLTTVVMVVHTLMILLRGG